MPPSSSNCVLIVADPGRIAELAQALAEPLPQGEVDLAVSSGGDDTIELFESRRPRVVVLTATLEVGDAKSLIEVFRGAVPRDEVVIVLVGDDETGPVRNALDAIDMKPDRFVSCPLSEKALRFAVGSGLDSVARALGETADPHASLPLALSEAGELRTSPTDDVAGDGSPASDGTQPNVSLGARTSTPLRGSGEPRRSIAPTQELAPVRAASPTVIRAASPSVTEVTGSTGTAGDDVTSEDEVVDLTNEVESIDTPVPLVERSRRPSGAQYPRATTMPRGSGPGSDEPAVPRSPMPQGGSAPLPLLDDGISRSVTTPRFSQLVEAGDVPPVVSRSLTRSVVPANGDPLPVLPRAPTDRGTGITGTPPASDTDQATRAALRARWEALADSIGGDESDDDIEEVTEDRALPLPPIEIMPRRKGGTNPDFTPVPPVAPWRPGTTSEIRDEIEPPPREPTLILHDDVPPRVTPPIEAAPAMPPTPVLSAIPAVSRTNTPEVTARGPSTDRWSQPVLLSELIDRGRDSSRELLARVRTEDDLAGLDELDDDIIVGHPVHTPPPHVLRGGSLQRLEDLVYPEGRSESDPLHLGPELPPEPAEPPARPSEDRIGGRDFARQLRAKMSMMAQRLFQSSGDSQASQPAVDVRPRHDHHTEIDLAALAEEPALGGGVTEIGRPLASDQVATSPGSWDTQVRERGLPDSGEIVRGISDVAMIVARMFAISFTGRVGFRRDEVEKIVYFDQGRPVFAASNEPGDRMGELLVREGKITASQYERCQVVVAQSGRRIGEILVDFGYLKRRELLPAVRRHVEDIVYSLFGWDRGLYQVTGESQASAERIRLSRHPASLVLEGIRRKLDRTTLEKVLGPSSTVIEVPDRERLGGILNLGDLAQEERSALAAFDGQADLASVARTTGIDPADVLPLAWGLCVLGLASARRTETETEESNALVGETDLAIDRERVRARWQLVTEADYFALLGVRRDATGFEIRRAYQAARRDFAPDGFPTDLRRELARELDDISSVLDEAFRVLRDDRLRQTYLANLVE